MSIIESTGVYLERWEARDRLQEHLPHRWLLSGQVFVDLKLGDQPERWYGNRSLQDFTELTVDVVLARASVAREQLKELYREVRSQHPITKWEFFSAPWRLECSAEIEKLLRET